MPDIKITVRDKVATGDGSRIVCGNSDYSILFNFDAEWDDYNVKTARFVYAGMNGEYIDVVFSGSTCLVPVLQDTIGVYVGVYAGDLHTTTPAWFECDKSILCGGGSPAAPSDDVYNQIMERLNKLGTPDAEAIAAAVADYIAANPIAEKDPTVPGWAKAPTKPGYTASEVGADSSGTAASLVTAHNTGADTHNDIRLLIQGLTDRLNALADSDDTTLDQLSEIVAYIKSNRDLIAAVTTDKVSVGDIVNDLVTNAANKPLSAAQGVALKALVDSLSEEKVSFPKDKDGNVILGNVGWYAVSDGAGGIKWVDSAPSGGGETTTHGIIWDLVNVTSSNNAVSVSDGSSFATVLTPDDGYALGDVTITMGGEVITEAWNAETATVTIQSVTGDVIISCSGVLESFKETELDVTFYNVSSFTGATGVINFFDPLATTGFVRMATYDLIDCTDDTNIKLRLTDEDLFVDGQTAQCRCFLYSDTDGTLAGSANPNGEVYTNDVWGSPNISAETDYEFKTAGYYVRFVLGRSNAVSSNANWGTYLNTDGNVYIAKVSASTNSGSTETTATEDSGVTYVSFDRVYTDTGVYTESLEPKWDGMFSIHRGYSTAPENTLQAIWEAKKHGYNCCELDVRYSSDNYPVLCHNPTVTGTVDGESVTYTVAETPLATLLTVCVGNTAFPDAKICSLEDAMRLCRRIGMRPEIDYKISNEQIYKDCVALSFKYGLQDDTLHCCYSIEYALAVKASYEKANLRVAGELLDSDSSLDAYLTKPGNLYAFYSAAACGKTDGSNVGENVENETRILTHKAKGYKMYVWNATPYLLPDVMQWEPDILQPQSAKDTNDFYSLIRYLNSFDGLVW